jgi:hypothetical protein
MSSVQISADFITATTTNGDKVAFHPDAVVGMIRIEKEDRTYLCLDGNIYGDKNSQINIREHPRDIPGRFVDLTGWSGDLARINPEMIRFVRTNVGDKTKFTAVFTLAQNASKPIEWHVQENFDDTMAAINAARGHSPRPR